MNFNFRNILLGSGQLRTPTPAGGGYLYKFDGPTVGLYFQSNLGEYRRLYVFDGTEDGLHFYSDEEAKNPDSQTASHLYKFDQQVDTDELGRTWALYFQSGDGENQSWPFTSELSVVNLTGSTLTAGWTVASSCKFLTNGYLADGRWDVEIRPQQPSGFFFPHKFSLDLSAYPGAALSRTRAETQGGFINYPLPYSATGQFRMSVGPDTTPLILAESHPDVLRVALDALPVLQGANLVIKRWGVPESSRLLAYLPWGPYWYFRTNPLWVSGIISPSTTFRLQYGGDTTGDIPITASSATIAAALNALPSISSIGTATVSRLTYGATAESGYNENDCGANNELHFSVTFNT